MNVYAIPGMVRTIGDRVRILKKSPSQALRVAEDVICAEWGIPPARLYEKTRLRQVVEPRQLMFFWMAKNTKETLESIGAVYKKDHATVLHGKRAVENLIETNAEYREKFDNCMQQIEEVLYNKTEYATS